MLSSSGVFYLVLIVSCASSRSVSGHSSQSLDNEIPGSPPASSSSSGLFGEFSYLFKTYQQCSKKDLSTCLKVKLVSSLDNASRRIKDLDLTDGIKFVQDSVVQEDVNSSLTEYDIEKELPRSLEEKDERLNSLIFEKVFSFLQSHTLQIKFPTAEEMQRSLEDSRGSKKKKKGNGAFVMIPLLLGGTFVPIAYGALAMLAGKALIVSKLALVLASIIGIKKLLSGSQSKEAQHEVVVSGGHSGSGWGREFDLAYNAYLGKDKNKALYH